MAHSRQPIDVHVGSRVRLRRIQLDYSKDLLAVGLGLTSDEMSAREEGATRIGAKMLMCICVLLDVEPPYFFEGFPIGDDEMSEYAREADMVSALEKAKQKNHH